MKGLSKAAYAVIAIVSILAVMLFAYLWATKGITSFAVIIFVAVFLFVFSVNKCAK